MNPTRRTFLKTAGAFFAGALSLPATFIYSKPREVPQWQPMPKRTDMPEHEPKPRGSYFFRSTCRVCGENHVGPCCADHNREEMWNVLE